MLRAFFLVSVLLAQWSYAISVSLNLDEIVKPIATPSGATSSATAPCKFGPKVVKNDEETNPLSLTAELHYGPGFGLVQANSTISQNSSAICTGCNLQIFGVSTLTFPYAIESITSTVSVVPYITVYNGANYTATNYKTITSNKTLTLGGYGQNGNATSIPTGTDHLTWTWSGVTL